MTRPAVFIGHSHVNAIALTRDANIDVINLRLLGDAWLEAEPAWRLREDLAERITDGQRVFMLLGGGAPFMLGLLEYPKRFDFILPSAPDLPLDERREIVPADALSARLAEMSAAHIDSIAGIVALAEAPVVQLLPPPPLADASAMRPYLDWGEYEFEIASKWVRYKLWRLHCELMEAVCERHGIVSVQPPRDGLDAEGFLHPECNADAGHGNAAYGALVLRDLRAAGLVSLAAADIQTP